VVVAAVLGGSLGAYRWSQQQYYVGAVNNHVAIYQGVSQKVGPLELSHLVDESDIALTNLPDFYRSRLGATVSIPNIEEARRLVTDLRVQAIACQSAKASSGTCGTAKP